MFLHMISQQGRAQTWCSKLTPDCWDTQVKKLRQCCCPCTDYRSSHLLYTVCIDLLEVCYVCPHSMHVHSQSTYQADRCRMRTLARSLPQMSKIIRGNIRNNSAVPMAAVTEAKRTLEVLASCRYSNMHDLSTRTESWNTFRI